MRTLENNIKDRNFLFNLLSKGINPNVNVVVSHFTSEFANSLISVTYVGKVTEIDLNSGYCKWVNENGVAMPYVNINCISILK